MAGFSKTKDDINNRSGQLVVTLRNTFTEIDRFKAFLDATPDADLVALGFTSAEVATIKSSFTDLSKLSRISRAQDTQSPASDFFFFAKQLTGVL